MVEDMKEDIDIYNMELHQSILLDNIWIVRVPGGWVYTISHRNHNIKDNYYIHSISSVFVPYNEVTLKRGKGSQ